MSNIPYYRPLGNEWRLVRDVVIWVDDRNRRLPDQLHAYRCGAPADCALRGKLVSLASSSSLRSYRSDTPWSIVYEQVLGTRVDEVQYRSLHLEDLYQV